MPDMPDSPVIAGVADLPKFYFAEGSAFRLVANIDADLPLSGKFVSFGTRARSGTVRRIFSTDSGESNLTISSQAITLNIGTGDETVPAFSGGWTLADVQSKGETEYWIDISATEGGDVILRLQGQADWVAAGSEIANSSATVTTPEIDVTITSGAVSVTASVVGGEVGVPAGGSTGQVLRKLSATDYATEWATVSGTGDVVGPASSTDNAIVRFDGTGGTSIQNSGITVADGASGTLSGSNSGDVTLAGALDYLTISGQAITRGAIDLATDVTGTLPVANGGTGQTSLGAINAADFGSGAATDNYVLTADGAGGTTWEAASGAGLGTVTSVAVSGSDGIQVDSGSPITSSGTIAIGIDASALKTHLSLGNVENTALSTWAGSTSITTIGTIATGTVPLANVSGTGDAAAKNTGSTAGTVCAGDDSRLSDARTPTSHVHGNLSNAGAIGSTSGLPIKTGTSGVLEAGAFGTGSGQFAQGNDSRFHDVVTLAGTPDYITLSGQVLTRGQIDLTADVTGILPHGNLGTGGGGSTKFLREDSTFQTISGGGDALTSSTLDQFADVTQTAGQTLAITSSTTLGGGSHSGTNTGDNAVNSLYSGLVSNATHTGDVTGSTTLTIEAGAVTEAKCNSSINASLDLADSSIQPGNAALTDERVPTSAGLTSKFGTAKGSIVDGDKFGMLDSAATDAPKHTLWSVIKSTLKTYFDTLYSATGHTHAQLHDAATVSGNGIALSGQQISLDIGTGSTQVAAGNHSHAQLHDAATVSGNGIAISGQEISLSIGTGSTQVAAGNHGHSAFTGDSGSGGAAGFVPAPSAGDAAAGKYLDADGTWTVPPSGGDALVANPLSQFAATTSSQLAGVISDETGSGALVFSTSPTLVTPALGTPSSGTLTNCTGLPNAAVVGLGGAALLSVGTTAGTVAAGDHGHSTAGMLGITIDGAGSAITTGIKGYLRIPYACTISSVDLVADQTGSIVIDVWKDTYANFPPTDADSITASAPSTLSSAQKSQDSTLTGWTTSLAAGDYLAFNVDSVSTVTRVTLALKVTRTI